MLNSPLLKKYSGSQTFINLIVLSFLYFSFDLNFISLKKFTKNIESLYS